jgi:Transposase IS116/IS110/IS902 family
MRELFGVGPLCAPTILAELGDARRFAGGDAVVRYAGLDITVWSSDTKRSPGHLARQGPEVLRWALFAAAKSSARRTAPDHAYDAQVKDRLSANRATLSTARKLARHARHARHVLVELGEEALAPVCGDQLPPLLAVALPEAASWCSACGWCPQRDSWAAAGSRKAPAVTRWRGRPRTAERPRTPGITPSIILSPRPGASTQIRLGAPAPTAVLPSLTEVAHDLTPAAVSAAKACAGLVGRQALHP